MPVTCNINASPNTGPRKLIVRPFNVSPQLPCNYESENLGKLSAATSNIFNQNALCFSEVNLYKAVHSLCLHGKADRVFTLLKTKCDELIKEKISDLASFDLVFHCNNDICLRILSFLFDNVQDEDVVFLWLHRIKRLWQSYTKSVVEIRKVFSFLDRCYVMQSDAKSINYLCSAIFRHHFTDPRFCFSPGAPATSHGMVDDVEMTDRVKTPITVKTMTDQCILYAIGYLRKKSRISSLLSSIIQMYKSLELYLGLGNLEHRLLDDTSKYYSSDARFHIDALTTKSYLRHSEQEIIKESKRFQSYLSRQTHPKIVNIMMNKYIRQYRNRILQQNAYLSNQSLSTPEASSHSSINTSDTSNNRRRRKSGISDMIDPISLESVDYSGASPEALNQRKHSNLDSSRMYSPPYILDLLIEEESSHNTFYTLFYFYDFIGELNLLKQSWCECIKRSIWRIYFTSLGISMPPAAGEVFSITTTRDSQNTLIPSLLEWRRKLKSCLTNSFFKHHDEFQYAMEDIWQECININSSVANLTAYQFARHCDEVLRLRVHRMTETELESKLTELINLFKHLQSKDYFDAFYKRSLSKRLLLGKAVAESAEKMMIQKIKDECGSSFTSKLEGMFREMEMSKETFQQFIKEQNSKTLIIESGVDFNAQVFASSIWPHPYSIPNHDKWEQRFPNQEMNSLGNIGGDSFNSAAASSTLQVIYPPITAALQNAYAEFYGKIHRDRNIRWIPQLGTCVLRFCPNPATQAMKFELVVSLIQGMCLILFNEHKTLAASQIQQMLNIEERELHRQLLSLCVDPKRRILIRRTEACVQQSSSTDQFLVHIGFTSHIRRLYINQIQLTDTKRETETSELRVEEDRTYNIDAAIVKTMKTNKQINHNLLLTEVISQIKFSTTAAAVKRRIDSLVDREYIERDVDNPQIFKYIS